MYLAQSIYKSFPLENNKFRPKYTTNKTNFKVNEKETSNKNQLNHGSQVVLLANFSGKYLEMTKFKS